jgi:hypothetical protein
LLLVVVRRCGTGARPVPQGGAVRCRRRGR